MSKFVSKIKEVFCEKRDVEVERLTMSDIKETLSEMGYECEEGSKSSMLGCMRDNIMYQFEYEDFRLDMRMYVFSEELSLFNIFKVAAERVNNEFGFVKTWIKLREDGSYFVLFACNVFIESKKEFEKFFPCYLREIKDGYVWFKRYCQELYEHLGHNLGEENESDSRESNEKLS